MDQYTYTFAGKRPVELVADLVHASRDGQTEIVKMLLDLDSSHGVDPSVNDNCVLLSAALSGHTEIVRMLLELNPSRGVNPSVNKNQAIPSQQRHEGE